MDGVPGRGLRRAVSPYEQRANLPAEPLLVAAQLGDYRPRANFQIQVLCSLFYRNKGAYVVGKIINGFSDLIVELYGPEAGVHARSAIGVAELPFGIPVEIEATVEIS